MRRPARLLGAALSAVLVTGTASAQPQPQRPPPGMQWLYGSGEGGAASVQAWRAFRDYVLAVARRRPAPRQSVVMWLNATLAAPSFYSCQGDRLAVVLDVDETALLNLGFEYDDASHPGRPYDQQRWNQWEQTGAARVAPVPGAVEALAAIRRAGVTVIFNSNRRAETAAQTEAALNGAGLGPAWHGPTQTHGRTLYLQGDDESGPHKDYRRDMIVANYCVIAMAGDQLGDFTDLFNADGVSVAERRAAASTGPLARMWGHGWFILPNPVYGSGLRGTIDEIFPADRRWPDPQGGH